MGYFPSGPGVKTRHFQCRGDRVCSLVGELGSPTCYEAKIQRKIKREKLIPHLSCLVPQLALCIFSWKEKALPHTVSRGHLTTSQGFVPVGQGGCFISQVEKQKANCFDPKGTKISLILCFLYNQTSGTPGGARRPDSQAGKTLWLRTRNPEESMCVSVDRCWVYGSLNIETAGE